EQWYLQVRRPLFGKEKFEGLIYSGAIGNLSLAKKERIKRIKEMVEKIPAVAEGHKNRVSDSAAGGELRERVEEVCALFGGVIPDKVGAVHRDSFLSEFEKYIKNSNQDYVRTVQGLPETVSQEGTRWLQEIVDELCRQAAVILPSMGLFKKKAPAKET
ncbi:MAG: UDP-N-acetylglucosamine pyrophosphorylase, partial [Desulfobacteraceae bacterium]|nr:UDP-N-acetylglucosamine pyrophosphorylase [Desulfobacteraceae bacterium]